MGCFLFFVFFGGDCRRKTELLSHDVDCLLWSWCVSYLKNSIWTRYQGQNPDLSQRGIRCIRSRKNGLACRPYPFFSKDWQAQSRPFSHQNQISVTGPAAANGSYVGGCLRGVRLSPPRVISAWWPRPRRHERVADAICSRSAVTWRDGNQRCEGGLRKKDEWAGLVSPRIYLPDTLNSARPAENHPCAPPPPPHENRILMRTAEQRARVTEEHLANWPKWYFKTYAYLIAGIAAAFSENCNVNTWDSG